jgi:tetratricopeptide (TPR) repeat protein
MAVRLWDPAYGRLLAVLAGHTAGVRSIAFSPDGRRLVSAGSDFSVRFWDPHAPSDDRAVQEVDRYPVPWTSVVLAFHPDGRRLALGGGFSVGSDLRIDHTLAFWDAREPTPELVAAAQARSRLAFLSARQPAEAVREQLVQDGALDSSARDYALALVDEFARAHARRKAADLVDILFYQGLFRTEILDRLDADRTLGEAVRREAIELAEASVDRASTLNRASRAVVRDPRATPAACDRALRQAKTACRLVPYEPAYQTTLGMALYRVGQYDEATRAFSRADQVRNPPDERTRVIRLAFRAMSEYRAGRLERARADLDDLTNRLRTAEWGHDPELDGFLHEAGGLIVAVTSPAGAERPGPLRTEPRP